jgi:DnaJ-class molecular chaperone
MAKNKTTKPEKEEVVVLKITSVDCAECGGQGLKDTTQLCGVCAGTGKSI